MPCPPRRPRVLAASAAALSLALALPACKQDLGVPVGAQLRCDDGRCPEGWTCNASLGQCIRNDVLDSVAPALVAAPAVSPRDVALGATVRVSFDVSEALLRPPAVRLDAGTPRTLALDAAASSGTHWEFTYAPGGDEPQGTSCPLTIDLVDRQGLRAGGLAGGALRFDFSPPSLSAPTLGGSPVGPGGLLRLAFTVSEPLAAPPVAALSTGEVLQHVPALSSGLDHVFEYRATGAELEGVPSEVRVTLTDAAGNTGSDLPAGAVVFDRTPPALSSVTVTPRAARDGTLVQVSFVASEELGADPVVVLSGATSVALDKGAQVGPAYAYGHVAVPADGEAVRAVAIRLVDRAGLVADVDPGGIVTFDFSSPVVAALEVCLDDGGGGPCTSSRTTFGAVPPFDRMKVSLSLSEPIAAPAVTVGGVALPVGGSGDGCVSADVGRSWVCRHQVADAAGGASPRVETATVGVVATDAAGNAGSASRWVTLDFDPPALAGSPYLERCDGYAPARLGAADLWTKPVAAYAGPGCPYGGPVPAPVRVHFGVSEPVALGAGGVALDDGTPLVLDPLASTSTQLVALLATDPAEGLRTVRADVVDGSGNARSLALGTLRVDLTAPPRPDTTGEGRIVYHRAPNGLDLTGGATRYVLVGSASAVDAAASVVAYDGPDLATAGALGRTAASASGAFGAAPGAAGAFEISAANLPEVWVAQEDAAGNSSPPAVVWDGVWYATMGGKAPGATLVNPNVFTEQPLWRASRSTTAQREPADPAAVAIRAAAGLTTSGQPELRPQQKIPGAPSPRGSCRMVYDGDRGRALLFGGGWTEYATQFPFFDDGTWTWDGSSWQQQLLDVRPPGRMGHGLAQDEPRGRTVLFGGCQGDAACSTLLGDTWEHDGSAWRQVCWPGCTAPSCTCTTMPSPRSDAVMFYDALGGRTVLFGGDGAAGPLRDTWVWDGADWRRLLFRVDPPARGHALFDVDPATATALVAGGVGTGGTSLSDALVWNGTDWTSYAPTIAVSWTMDQVWFDQADRKFYAMFSAIGRLREWDGTTWRDLGYNVARVGDLTAFGEARWGTCGAYDRERGAFVRFGGCLNSGASGCRSDYAAHDETWIYAGGTFRQLSPGAAPEPRYGAGLTWFPLQEVAKLFGGKSTGRYSFLDDWSWDGVGWTTVTAPNPPASSGGRYGGAMAAVSPSVLVRYGGNGYDTVAFPSDTFCNTGTGFTSCWGGLLGTYAASDPNTVGTVAFQAMAYDPPRANAVYLRGDNAGATWTARWVTNYWAVGTPSGVLWERRATSATPPSTAGHQMTYCAVNDGVTTVSGVFLFGGSIGATLLAETWLWNGTDWAARAPLASPPARRGHVLLCDEDRRKLYVLGGLGAAGHLADVWEYDGTTWRERTPLEVPTARREAAAAWAPTTGRGVLYSGWSGAQYFGDTWIWNGGRDERPAHVLRAAFGSTGVAGFADVRGVDVSWWAGGSSIGGAGATLHLWDRGRWNAVASSRSATPAQLAWSTATDAEWGAYPPATLASRVRRLFAGDARELSLAVTSRGTNGTAPALATVTTSYAEVKVRYRLTCRAAGVASRDPALCCSLAAAAGRCL